MKNMTEGNISKNFIGFAIPIILAGILSQAYGIADSMVVGRLLGEQGLASVGSTAAIITVCSSIIWGLGTGIALYIAILYGSGDFSDMTASVKANLVLIFGFA
jgi:Na+-driven multidrug efflux pump